MFILVIVVKSGVQHITGSHYTIIERIRSINTKTTLIARYVV